jgi:hypothetical protein
MKTPNLTNENHIIFYQFGFLAVLVVVIFFVRFSGSTNEGVADLTLDMGDYKREFQGPVVDGMTVLDALNASVLAGGINFKFALTEEKTEIIEINDHGKIGDYNLDFYLNSQRIDDSEINKISIKPEDRVLVQVVSR